MSAMDQERVGGDRESLLGEQARRLKQHMTHARESGERLKMITDRLLGELPREGDVATEEADQRMPGMIGEIDRLTDSLGQELERLARLIQRLQSL